MLWNKMHIAFILRIALDGSIMTSVDELNMISNITLDDGVDGEAAPLMLIVWLAAYF